MSENTIESATAQTPRQQPAARPVPASKSGGRHSPLLIGLGAAVLAVLLYFGLNYFAATLTSETTDDAFIAGHIVSVAPRIAGQVSAVYVVDNEFVRSNQLLVELDPSDYQAALGQKRAAQDAAQSNLKAAIAGYNLMGVKVKTAEADARESQADAAASAATAARAASDFARAKELMKENTISPEEFDQFKASAAEAEADLKSADAKAASDASRVNEARAQLAAAKAESNAVMAQLNESKTELDSAELNLSYTKIYAPRDGLVTRKQVEPGDYLEAGQTMFSIVSTDVWVTANFKESQLRDMEPNQKARVSIDALGGRTFRAHVDSVQAGSGAVFSLLPPENAVGNYVKVVQRVPVKIVFDQPLPANKTIGPGLSVVPTVMTSTVKVPKFLVAIVAVIAAIAAAIGFKAATRK
ncbi:MAG: HlyD family secretion protein [Limisphaerales bacterium]